MLAPMRQGFLALAALMLAVFPGAARAQEAPARRAPVVVELYTSQGCSSCPRANRLLGQFAAESGVIALTFPVGYWDYLGWTDTFAQPEFTARQRAFSRALRTRAPFTPQLVIDGVRQMSAADWDEARGALEEVQAASVAGGTPRVTIQRLVNRQTRVTISAAADRTASADIWLMAYDPGPVTVLITEGENANRRVSHYNLVRWMRRVGGWNGNATWFDRPRCTPECVVIVQEPRGGRVLAAATTRAPR